MYRPSINIPLMSMHNIINVDENTADLISANNFMFLVGLYIYLLWNIVENNTFEKQSYIKSNEHYNYIVVNDAISIPCN